MPPRFQHARIALLAAAPLTLVSPFLLAPALADASAWDGDKRASIRLVAAAQRGSGASTVHRAGVEIRLAPGWKTYWRYPGDSGVPPRFDFAGSDNLKSVTVRYPAPHRFVDGGGTSLGYAQSVLLPLHIEPSDPAKPVTLSLKLDYALCEKLCVPAEGRAALTVSGKPGSSDDALAAAEALVPRAARLGSDAPLAVRAVKREDKRILVDVAPAGEADLFVEGPTADWALPIPTPVDGAPAGAQRFAFELDGLPPGAKPEGATLTLTAVAGKRAIEVPFRLD